MAINEIVYNNQTLISLVNDSVTPDSLLDGKTAHDASGNLITGTAVIPKKLSELEDDISVLAHRTYKNIIATSNNQTGGTFYFAQIAPNSFYEPCRVKFRVRAYINAEMTDANRQYFQTETITEQVYSGVTLNRYHNQNGIYSTSYRPIYYITTYRASQAGQTAGYPHYIGACLYNSTSPTAKSLKRDIEVELLEYENCTVTMLDEMVLQSAFYNADYYAGVSNTDACNNGTKMTGDNNTIDRLCYGSFTPTAGAAMYGTQLILSDDGQNWYSICNSRSIATSKTCTTQGFRPEHILYYSASGTVAVGSKPTSTGVIYESIPFDSRYSHNLGSTLTTMKPIYLKCTKSGELYYLVTSGWVTQNLPTSDDGYYYILLGYAYTSAAIYLKPQHPVYLYRDGAIQEETSARFADIRSSYVSETYMGQFIQSAMNTAGEQIAATYVTKDDMTQALAQVQQMIDAAIGGVESSSY